MMVIVTEQIDALTQAQFARFERRVHSFLRANPGKRDPELLTESVVRRIVADARRAGIHSERMLALYATGVWHHGDHFLAAVEPLRDRFEDDKTPPATKAKLLQDAYESLQSAG